MWNGNARCDCSFSYLLLFRRLSRSLLRIVRAYVSLSLFPPFNYGARERLLLMHSNMRCTIKTKLIQSQLDVRSLASIHMRISCPNIAHWHSEVDRRMQKSIEEWRTVGDCESIDWIDMDERFYVHVGTNWKRSHVEDVQMGDSFNKEPFRMQFEHKQRCQHNTSMVPVCSSDKCNATRDSRRMMLNLFVAFCLATAKIHCAVPWCAVLPSDACIRESRVEDVTKQTAHDALLSRGCIRLDLLLLLNCWRDFPHSRGNFYLLGITAFPNAKYRNKRAVYILFNC